MQSFPDEIADEEAFNRKFKDTQFTEISTNRFYTQKKDFIESKKIVCLKGLFWFKQKIYLN